MTVRFATASDIPEILRFIGELAKYERLAVEVIATEEKLASTLFGDRAFAEVLIAEDEGAPVGFALFFHNYSTWLAQPGIYLEDLYVEPSARGGGHGKELLIRLSRLSVERDCGRLEWSVLDWNSPAIEFYESLGAFKMDGWSTFRLTGDALKNLGSD